MTKSLSVDKSHNYYAVQNGKGERKFNLSTFIKECLSKIPKPFLVTIKYIAAEVCSYSWFFVCVFFVFCLSFFRGGFFVDFVCLGLVWFGVFCFVGFVCLFVV